METCDMAGCDSPAEYLDKMDNRLCQDCMEREIKESGTSQEDYETTDREQDK